MIINSLLASLFFFIYCYNYDLFIISNGRKQLLATWKKPMLVKGPLGIVSGIELAFLIMFVALLVWSLSTYLHDSFSTITPQSAAESGETE